MRRMVSLVVLFLGCWWPLAAPEAGSRQAGLGTGRPRCSDSLSLVPGGGLMAGPNPDRVLLQLLGHL